MVAPPKGQGLLDVLLTPENSVSDRFIVPTYPDLIGPHLNLLSARVLVRS